MPLGGGGVSPLPLDGGGVSPLPLGGGGVSPLPLGGGVSPLPLGGSVSPLPLDGGVSPLPLDGGGMSPLEGKDGTSASVMMMNDLCLSSSEDEDDGDNGVGDEKTVEDLTPKTPILEKVRLGLELVCVCEG